MHIPTPKSQAPNPKCLFAWAVGIWALGFGISISAQSPYVAGTIGADVSRVSHTDSSFGSSPSSNTEVVSGSLRVGTAVSQTWGVELEFVRSGQSHRSQNPIITPLQAGGLNVGALTPSPTGTIAINGIPVPIGGFQSDIRQSHSDFDAVAWVRQGVGGSVDLVYLGGLAFSRQRVEITQTFPAILRTLVPGGTFRTTAVDYATRPLVGAEARIGLTSHVRLIPGLRLQGLGNGWLLRPYAGLGWFF